jgi:sterol desaturase/sphingolipid hydroxylase (fatty acid hydroxylase superfamily)
MAGLRKLWMLKNHLIGFVTGSSAFFWLLLCFVGLAAERLRPYQRRQPAAAVLLNLGYAVCHAWAVYALGPIVGVLSVAVANRLGGGVVQLPATGWGLIWAIPSYLLAMDFAEYLFHRAQHAWPPLWAMHSLHHSETALNVTTTLRHFWLEAAVKGVFVYPCVGLLFKPSAAVTAVWLGAAYWNFVAHMNWRLSFGKLWPLLNSPQYHRLHHAADPAYLNRNFVALFPVFDLIFGTCRRPRPNEYPAVGLPGGEAPANLIEAMLWPVRRLLPGRWAAGRSSP